MRAEIDQARRAQEGDKYRVVRAALDRYCQIEELIDERRALARRLGLPAIERECDQKFVKLASAFPAVRPRRQRQRRDGVDGSGARLGRADAAAGLA